MNKIKELAKKFGEIEHYLQTPHGVTVLIKRKHISCITLENIKNYGFEFISVIEGKDGILLQLYYPIMEKIK